MILLTIRAWIVAGWVMEILVKAPNDKFRVVIAKVSELAEGHGQFVLFMLVNHSAINH